MSDNMASRKRCKRPPFVEPGTIQPNVRFVALLTGNFGIAQLFRRRSWEGNILKDLHERCRIFGGLEVHKGVAEIPNILFLCGGPPARHVREVIRAFESERVYQIGEIMEAFAARKVANHQCGNRPWRA